MSNIGVITEQGFVVGDNLGFSPVSEDLQPKKDNDKNKEKDK